MAQSAEAQPLLAMDEKLAWEAGSSSPKSCSKASTRSRKLRLHTILFLYLSVVAITFYWSYPNVLGKKHKHKHHKKPGVCLTPACVHASSEILYNLSPNHKKIDPCSNFEELVCGGWSERHDLRPDQGDAFTGTIMSETSQTLLRHILEAGYPDQSAHSSFSPMQLLSTEKSTDEQNFEKLKNAYDACLNEDAIKAEGDAPLKEILQIVRDSFPVTSPNPDALFQAVYNMAVMGVSGFISTGAGADDRDPDTVVVEVSAPWSIGLPAKESYLDAPLVQKYQTALGGVMMALYPGENLGSLAGEVIDLEKKLAAATPDADDRQDVTKYYNPMSLDQANALAPRLQLKDLIANLAPEKVKLDRIIVMTPDYLSNLTRILDETTLEAQQAYLLWKVVQGYSSLVESDSIKPYKQFRNVLQGKDPDADVERWRTCVGHVDDGLGWILSRFFVEKAFSAKAKKFGDQIVSDIKTEFSKKLKKTKWMEDKVIKLALEKVHNIVQKIGYPTKSPDIMNPSRLQKYYQSISISKDGFFANGLAMNKFGVQEEWKALGKPVDRDQWGMTVPTVNAYYNPPGNEIVFPAGIMQFPVFDVNVPQYLSYGAFGSVSGHELSHAFDSTGRHYDQNGNYTDWWTDKTVKAFSERAECFVKQYANFTVEGSDGKPLHVNGRLTLGENIADAGGLSAAFSAWKLRAKEAPELNQDLPGLSEIFTQEQLFFVSYSNWWCGKSRKETAINRIFTDPHAPKWARILGTMANSRDFKEAFQCKEKKPVCELW